MKYVIRHLSSAERKRIRQIIKTNFAKDFELPKSSPLDELQFEYIKGGFTGNPPIADLATRLIQEFGAGREFKIEMLP